MYKALKKGIAYTGLVAIDLELATQEDLKKLYEIEEICKVPHELVEKVEAKKSTEK